MAQSRARSESDDMIRATLAPSDRKRDWQLAAEEKMALPQEAPTLVKVPGVGLGRWRIGFPSGDQGLTRWDYWR